MIRRWPIPGEMTAECSTATLGGMHARCKSTSALCACDCHRTLEKVAQNRRMPEEMRLAFDVYLTRQWWRL